MQRILTPNPYEAPAGVAPFSWNHFSEHLSLLLRSQLDLKFFLPYPTLLTWAFAATLVTVLYRAVMHQSRTPLSNWAQLTTLMVAVQLILFLAHHMGIYSHPTQARFFIPLLCMMSIALVLLYHRLFPEYERWALVFALLCLALYHPVAVQNRFSNTLTLPRETKRIMETLENFKSKNILVVVDRPGQYTALSYGAVDHGYLKRNADPLKGELNRRLFQEMLLVQHYNYDQKTIRAGEETPAGYLLAPVMEFQNEGNVKVQISRVVYDKS